MTDRELLEHILQKNSTSFRTLYDRYCNLLNGWTYSRLRDKEVTADIMQEFWASIWMAPQNIRPDENGSAKQFMLQNVSFRILKYFHKQSVRIEVPNEEVISGQIQALSYTHVQEDISVKEIQQLVDDVLRYLPALHRQIYELRCLSDLSVKETASKLGIAESTVRNGLSTVRLSLRKKLILSYEGGKTDKFNILLPLLLFFLEN